MRRSTSRNVRIVNRSPSTNETVHEITVEAAPESDTIPSR